MIALPVGVIDLIMGIYNIIGMFNALSNITGNGICTSIVAYLFKSFDMNTLMKKVNVNHACNGLSLSAGFNHAGASNETSLD